MGALVTLEVPDDSPALDLPWIITFGPLDGDEEWEPLVCGPYERPHALALAETVVADEDLMAVVEPLLPSVSVDEIREEIAAAKVAAEQEASAEEVVDVDYDEVVPEDLVVEDVDKETAPAAPPSAEEIRAGFARIAAALAAR